MGIWGKKIGGCTSSDGNIITIGEMNARRNTSAGRRKFIGLEDSRGVAKVGSQRKVGSGVREFIDVRVGIASGCTTLEGTHGIIQNANGNSTWTVSCEVIRGFESLGEIRRLSKIC